MGGRGGMLVVSSGDGVIVEKVELCRKWIVGSAGASYFYFVKACEAKAV